MESIYAALLLHKAKKEISESAIEKILKAADATIDKGQVSKIVMGLKDADIEKIISSAAAAPVMAVAAAPAAGGAPAAAPAEGKKKKEEEKKEEAEPTGIGSLF